MEWFRGFKKDMSEWASDNRWYRSETQKTLDGMIDNYGRSGGREHEDTAKSMRMAMQLSPDLRARLLEAVESGHLVAIDDRRVEGGAAGYKVANKTISILPVFNHGDEACIELMFQLGHEVEHARSRASLNYTERALIPSVTDLAGEGQPGGTRDYTPIVQAFIENTRLEEGRAHLGGFNAVASFLLKYGSGDRLLEHAYEHLPERMTDFIDRTGEHGRYSYALKPELVADKDGLLNLTDRHNWKAMAAQYADRAHVTDDGLNYAQECIKDAWRLIDSTENYHALNEKSDVARAYTIDYASLGVDVSKLPFAAENTTQVRYGTEPLPAHFLEGLSGPIFSEAPEPISSLPLGTHPLFDEALSAVEALNEGTSLGDAQARRNIAAALALSAGSQGMAHIGSVEFNDAQTHLIAMVFEKQNSAPEWADRAVVEKSVAEATPERHSLNALAESLKPQTLQESKAPPTQTL
ncbi:MAG: hypothetical protein KA144_07330 [Xanthomonadaceae bacterium]|nr:hypothetical protein [Xanthomonadaceae bacterium]